MNGFLCKGGRRPEAAPMRATPRALARSAYKGCMHPLFHGVLYVVFTVILRNFVSYLPHAPQQRARDGSGGAAGLVVIRLKPW